MDLARKFRRDSVTMILAAILAWIAVFPARAQGPLDPHWDLRSTQRIAKSEFETASDNYAKKESELKTAVERKAADAILAAKGDDKVIRDAEDAKKKEIADLSVNEDLKALKAKVLASKEALDKSERAIADAVKAEDERLKTENATIYQETLALLTMFFVLALVLENALEVIFNWRVFHARFSNRGIRAPIMVIAAGLLVATFQLDILANLVALYKSRGFGVPPVVKSNFFTGLISAFVLAGGSAGVNRLMIALGVRKETPPITIPKPPADKAWIAIKLNRVNVVGDPLVHLERLPAPEAVGGIAPAAPAPLIGTIRKDTQSVRELMLRNTDRFPQNGGWEVDTVSSFKITVSGSSKDREPVEVELGPYRFAPGAIIDLAVTM